VDLVTGELTWMRCRANWCPVCLPVNARGVVDAVTMARPENMIRLTMDVDDPAHLVAGMATVRRWWRRNVGPWEDVYAIEENPRRNGLHLHGWQYGSRVDQGHLEQAAEIAGFRGSPYGMPRRLRDGVPLDYFVKDALYQPAHSMPPSAVRFRELNNPIVHNTRGFWRDWADQPVGTLRRAVQLARAREMRAPATTTL
jgi:hypothetical protein